MSALNSICRPGGEFFQVGILSMLFRQYPGEQFVVQQVADGMDDKIGRIAVLIQIAFLGDTAEGEDGSETHGARPEDIGAHGISHHDRLVGGQSEDLPGHAHHDGARLADAKGLTARSKFQHGDERAASCAVFSIAHGAVGVEVGGDQLSPVEDHIDGLVHGLEHDRPAFADDHIVGMIVYDRITDVVQLREQAALADHIGRTVLFAGVQIARRGHGAGKDVFVVDVEAHFAELVAYVPISPLTVVGQKKEGIALVPQAVDEFNGTRYGLAALVDNPVHIDKKTFLLHNSNV